MMQFFWPKMLLLEKFHQSESDPDSDNCKSSLRRFEVIGGGGTGLKGGCGCGCVESPLENKSVGIEGIDGGFLSGTTSMSSSSSSSSLLSSSSDSLLELLELELEESDRAASTLAASKAVVDEDVEDFGVG